MPTQPTEWRIDDLARESGLTVDTIRFYRREGLLPPATRVGRTKVYGAEHLERLERIRELQARRFSLAAIRTLLDTDRGAELVAEVFEGAGALDYSLEDLVERSGLDPAVVDAVRAEGLLREPGEYGRRDYDATDLDALRALAELRRIGMPTEIVLELVRIQVRHIEAMQTEVVEVFAGRRGPALDEKEFAEFRRRIDASAARMAPLVTRVVEYLHQRTTQRLALAAIGRRVAESGDTPA